MSKGVVDPIRSRAPSISPSDVASAGASASSEDPASRERFDSGLHRRNRGRHRRDRSNQRLRSTRKELELVLVTLVAIAILFAILYALLPRSDRGIGDESRLVTIEHPSRA